MDGRVLLLSLGRIAFQPLPQLARRLGSNFQETQACIDSVSLPCEFGDQFQRSLRTRQGERNLPASRRTAALGNAYRHSALTHIGGRHLQRGVGRGISKGYRNLHCNAGVAAAFPLHQALGRRENSISHVRWKLACTARNAPPGRKQNGGRSRVEDRHRHRAPVARAARALRRTSAEPLSLQSTMMASNRWRVSLRKARSASAQTSTSISRSPRVRRSTRTIFSSEQSSNDLRLIT